MSYSASLFIRIAAISDAIESERCVELTLETYEYCTGHERYADAALAVMIGCRRLDSIHARDALLADLADGHTWRAVLRVPFFRAWIEDVQRGVRKMHTLKMEEHERRSIEIETDVDLLTLCRRVFATSDRESQPLFGDGMNLIFFLNRSRRRGEASRLFNPACFGLQHVNVANEEERHSILGYVARGEIRVLDIQLGTSPAANEG